MTVLRLDEKQLRHYLGCYGSDMLSWPPEARAAGDLALRYPEFVAIIEEEQRFERLLSQRIYEKPHPAFADRIIARARTLPQRQPVRSLWMEPAAIAAVLVLGFTIGFGTSAIPVPAGARTIAQSYVDEDGTAL